MTPSMLCVKWENAVSVLSLDSLTGVRYLPVRLRRTPDRSEAGYPAGEYIVGV